MSKNIDHEYTDDIVCPYCGYTHRDSWELGADYGDHDCGSCGKIFLYERDIVVSYSTSKTDQANQKTKRKAKQ